MGTRPILALLATCVALFGISFAVGALLQRDEDRTKPTSARSPSPVAIEEPTLALGQVGGLPDLRRKPRKQARTDAAASVAPSPAAAAQGPASAPSVEPAPSGESAPSAEPAPAPAAPAPVQQAPVQQQAPVTTTQPRSSTPNGAPSSPAPDAAPSQPSPSPDPYASGGSTFYDDGG
jgi:hypothetical protein